MTWRTVTHGSYCSLQCGIVLAPRPDGSVELTGRDDFPVNRGGLCIKGANAAELLHPRHEETPDAQQAPFTAGGSSHSRAAPEGLTGTVVVDLGLVEVCGCRSRSTPTATRGWRAENR